MADEGAWKLQDDGYLNIDEDPDGVIYHPNLNVLVVLSKNGVSTVVDINSGSVLRKCAFSGEPTSVQGTYLPSYDKVLLLNSKAIGVRSDYNGVLLLDTMLQTPIKTKLSTVKLEMLLSEAILLHNTLKSIELSNTEFPPGVWSEVLAELDSKIEAAQSEPKKSAKAQKWNIICLELKHSAFQCVCSNLVSELKRQNRHVPALAIASALNERLNSLHTSNSFSSVEASSPDSRNLMFSEAARRETFAKWPHMDYKWALPGQMAQAGFYHQPNSTGDDRAMCFTCVVCLVCWEPTDEPWAEHERHSPCCPFVKGEYTQNVPLSVTYATMPAILPPHQLIPNMSLVDISTLPGLIPVCSKDGFVSVLNYTCQLKIETELNVRNNYFDLNPNDIRLTCAAIAAHSQYSKKHLESEEGDCNQQNWDNVPRPGLILGTQITITLEDSKRLNQFVSQKITSEGVTSVQCNVDPPEDVEMSSSSTPTPTKDTYLLVMDFHFQPFKTNTSSAKQTTSSVKKNISGTGTSTASVGKMWEQTTKSIYMHQGGAVDDLSDSEPFYGFGSPASPDLIISIDNKGVHHSTPSTSSACKNPKVGLAHCMKSLEKAEKLLKKLGDSAESVDLANSIKSLLEKKHATDSDLKKDFLSLLDNSSLSGAKKLHLLTEHRNLIQKKELLNDLVVNCIVDKSDSSDYTSSVDGVEKSLMIRDNKLNSSAVGAATQAKHVPELSQIVLVPTKSADAYVKAIHPLQDFQHVLVILSDGVVHLYALDHSDKSVKLSEKPVISSNFETESEGVNKTILLPQDQTTSVMACITNGGHLIIMDIFKLEVLSRLEPTEDQEFVALTYCNSLERICVATSKGSLRFYALKDEDEFKLNEDASSSPVMKKKMSSMSASSSTNSSEVNVGDNLIVNRATYGFPELKAMYDLTLFENLSPGFTATVPACWTELMQAQKQRRHAQHLTREDIHTRSWRLQNDLTTWDEHMLELSLPKNTIVGRVDVKLTFHTPCLQVPPIQVTLLRPITSRAPFQSSNNYTTTPIDSSGSFFISNDDAQNKVNPTTSESYSNSEILSGPVNISNWLDLSGQSCTISFSSPKLLKSKNRQLLIHIKAINFYNKNTSTSSSKSKYNKDPSAAIIFLKNASKLFKPSDYNRAIAKVAATSSKKNESFIGCDWIHEISITIRKNKATEVPNERLERTTMIESNQVVEKLIQTIVNCGDPIQQSIALDVLIWIGMIRLGRLRSTYHGNINKDQHYTLIKTIETHLRDLLHTCFILGGRSIARKCAKLLIICSDGMKNATDTTRTQFDVTLLKVLVDLLPYICMSWSAGSVRWFFQIFIDVLSSDTGGTAPQRCLDILNAIGAQLAARQNPYHSILRTRFGLDGTPLEPELFECEPPIPSKFTPIPVSYANIVATNEPWISDYYTNNVWDAPTSNVISNTQSNAAGTSSSGAQQNSTQWMGLSSEPLDLKELLIPQSTDSKNGCKVKGITANHFMKGLLEVEPLHFTCHSMSDGTKLETIDQQTSSQHFNMFSNVNASSFLAKASSYNDLYKFEDASDDMSTMKYSDEFSFVDSLGTIYTSNPKGWKPVAQKPATNDSGKEYALPEKIFLKMYKENEGNDTTMDSEEPDLSSSHLEEPKPSTSHNIPGEPCSISWSQLLVPPPQQMMIIERMHSGARRFIVLDFGRPILLTDLLIPACSELLSLSIDIWCKNEETDAIRLVASSDIAIKNLILSDIQPPPICRYLKITTIGRYGMSTARCKIPVGSYYGHTLVLPGEDYAEKNSHNLCEINTKSQLQHLASLHEDIYCRYSLCCNKLKQYMSPLLVSETPNVVHMHRYFNAKKENNLFPSEPKDKIISCYKECVTYQHQLNIVKSVMRRLSPPAVTKNDPLVLAGSSDKLRLIGECLLDTLLYYVYEIGPVPKSPPSLIQKFDEAMCSRLFHAFCVTEDTRLQVATASLLVATCGPQPWWGSFLTSVFCQLFSSQQNLIYPQDRILMLFSWLGRKNLSVCSGIVDSLLYALLQQLAPLASQQNGAPSPGYLKANTDLSLITWLLLFLSQCLDCSGNEMSSEMSKTFGTRWDFMSGELAMQKQKLKPKVHNSSNRNRRHRVQKRLSSLMNAGSLSGAADILGAVKKNLSHHCKDSSDKSSKSNIASSGSASTSTKNTTECLVTPLISLPRHHCLPSAKAILAFILHLDFTCNVDTFLIACKDLSRIIISTRPTLSLNELMTEEELRRFVSLAVWSDQHGSGWGGPWTVHAVSCLLLDILGGAASAPPTSVKTDEKQSVSVVDVEEPATASCSKSPVSSESTVSDSSLNSLSPASINITPYVLPSVLESDDSDLDDFLDNILEKGRMVVHKVPSFVHKSSIGAIGCSMSLAMDSRLEYGIENNVEVILKRLTAQSAYNLPISINSSIPNVTENFSTEWDTSVTSPWLRDDTTVSPPSSIVMLSNCFNAIFAEFDTSTGWCNIEQTLELWLTLNGSGKSSDETSRKLNTSFVPIISLSPNSIATLIRALSERPNVSLRTWCLAFETLTLATNTPMNGSDSGSSDILLSSLLIGMSGTIINEPSFVKMMYKFLSSTRPKTNQLAGPSVCVAFHQFLVRLQARVLSFTSELGNQLKEHLLTLLYMLVQKKGPLCSQSGALDAQCEFIQHLLYLHFTSRHLPTAMSILESVGVLLFSYVTSLSTLKCLGVNEASINNPLACFQNIWTTVFQNASGGGPPGVDNKLLKPPIYQTLILNLLRFANKLIQIPLDEKYAEEEERDASQTDEHKVEQNMFTSAGGGASAGAAQASPAPPPIPCLADVVLKHKTTMDHLLGSLASCSSSSFAMILVSSNNLSFTDNFDPTSVGEAVFQIVYTLTSKASNKTLALSPILEYLSNWNNNPGGVFQLSEPFVWLLMKSLNNEESIKELLALDGVQILCKGLIQSHSLILNPHPSQVSVLMQHLSQFPTSNLSASVTSNKKVHAMAGADAYPSKLINFAPLGTISTPNPASQTPDVLIQPSPPHKRARSPAWSYHFFADEQSVELTISLPCAILLKEIQLQPHVTTLCTCPSAVALEVCHGIGTGMVPVGAPMETSGLTFIRLNLPQPEVVTGVLLRLYRAKDSSSLGLTQIRVIGSTTFGDTAFQLKNADIADEQKLTKSSIGWLRLINHLITVPYPDSPLLKSILDAAASQPLLLDTCASLLLIPAPPPSLFMPAREHVLLNLGLHSKELGLKLLDILLHNGAVTFMQGTLPLTKNTNASLESVIDLIYMLCTKQDAFTLDRISMLLTWLEDVADACLKKQESQIPPPSSYIHSAAVVLWSLHEQALSPRDLQTLASDQLFNKLYKWTLELNEEMILKKAIDNVLCSLCYVRPELFSSLLQKMGILVPVSMDATLHSASISDDRKDCEGLTDDSKGMDQGPREWYDGLGLCDLRQLKVSDAQLMTVAAACQSEHATRQLLDSGLPSRLANAVYEFCVWSQGPQSTLTDAEKATNNHSSGSLVLNGNTVGTILKFFTALCATSAMKNWLGSPDGSVFWFPLLNYLNQKTSESTSFGYSWELSSVIPSLEALTIKLLSECTFVHTKNQELLARVLSDLITQPSPHQADSQISGFTRRVVLQLLLENEKILVCIERPNVSSSTDPFSAAMPHPHPSFGIGHKQQLVYLSTDTTIDDILISTLSSSSDLPTMFKNGLKQKASGDKGDGSVRDLPLWEIQETLSATLTAGNSAKDKRLLKESCKNKPFKKRFVSYNGDVSTPSLSQLVLSAKHEKIAVDLPPGMTLSQLLYLHPPTTPYLKLTISAPNNKADNQNMQDDADDKSYLLSTPHLQTPLQVFSQMGGLALLAQHLPLVHPDHFHFPCPERIDSGPKSGYSEDNPDVDWVKIDYEIFDEMTDVNETPDIEVIGYSMNGNKNKKPESVSLSSHVSSVPPHSLSSFGLFLRLPGYADVLLKEKKQAQYLLRLVLGVTDDGEGGDIFKSPVARSLATVPFQVLQQLLNTTPLTTDDGVLLRKIALDIGVLHLLLTCLAYLTHLPTDLSAPLPGLQQTSNQKSAPGGATYKSDDKSHLYWAKGTGFGTGSTTQNWNIEQALSRQRLEEEHVTAMLGVLSSFIVPAQEPPDTTTPSPSLPALMKHLIRQSCLLPALASYLRNDSVLDMARHIPLYKGVLQLIRSMAQDADLAQLLFPRSPTTAGPASTSDSTSIFHLLCNMKSCVDIYLSRLKTNDNKLHSKVDLKSDSTKSNKKVSWVDQDEDLVQLVDDIRTTVTLVQDLARDKDCDMMNCTQSNSGLGTSPLKSIEERYLEVMRALQFDTYDMIVENEGGPGYKFTVSYHYEANVQASGDRTHPARMKRLAQETVTLSTALPLSYSSSVFVRCDIDRLDIMKVLITGPSDTPYANGCFEFDVYFPPEYPNSPMHINLETTGHHSVRFNPNLYNDGKVCLSILNTWHGRPEEKWNAQTSSFLQVLVSIQSLILVSEPYFNEPGYERSRGTTQATQSSREYNANIAQATVRWAMIEQIKNPTPCFKDVIHTHFWLKRKEIAKQIKNWITEMDSHFGEKRNARTISLPTLALKRHYNCLLEELAKLETPAGLEDMADQNTAEDMEEMFSAEALNALTAAAATCGDVSNSGTNLLPFFSLNDEDTENTLHFEHS